MASSSTFPQAGVYHYHYPTFVDTPQPICIHFITPDDQQAFVSYPGRACKKAAQLLPLSWFEGVILEPLQAESRLMPFLEALLVGWLRKPVRQVVRNKPLTIEISNYQTAMVVAA